MQQGGYRIELGYIEATSPEFIGRGGDTVNGATSPVYPVVVNNHSRAHTGGYGQGPCELGITSCRRLASGQCRYLQGQATDQRLATSIRDLDHISARLPFPDG